MPRNPDKGAAVANPAFVHYVDMNENGGSDDEIDIDEEIDIDALQYGAAQDTHAAIENPQYEAPNYEVFPAAPAFNQHAPTGPPPVKESKGKRDSVAILLSSFAILLALISIGMQFGFNRSNDPGLQSTVASASNLGSSQDGVAAAASSALPPGATFANVTSILEQEVSALNDKVAGLEQTSSTSAAALNASVAFLQSTVDHLMSKNDSVSYDMHIAALGAMMDKLADTNAKVLANAANASQWIERQTETTQQLNVDFQTLESAVSAIDLVKLPGISTSVEQLEAEANATANNVDSLTTKTVENENDLAFLQSTVDHLMSKNDSVSYDMHIAALEAMMDKLADTNTKVLANADATTELTSSIRSDYQALQDDVSTLSGTSQTMANQIELLMPRNETVAQLAALRGDTDSAVEALHDKQQAAHSGISANSDAIQKLESGVAANGAAIKRTNYSLVSIESTVDLVEEKQELLGVGVNQNNKGVGALNGTVQDLQDAIADFADPNADPTIKQQVKLISDAMKEYGLYTQCDVGSWSGFGKCSHECDGGTMERTRSIKPLAGYEDVKNACPVRKETITCNTGACPRDCKVGKYTNWTACSSQCGPGTQVRTRKLLQGAVGGGACPKLLETQECEVNSEDDQEECAKAVLDILDGTWKQNSTSSAGYKVCAGGEIDTAEKLVPFEGCQLIAGNLKFFVPVDFDIGSTFRELLAVSGDVSFYNTGLKALTKAAFPKLEAIGGTLLVAHNTALESCLGFQLLHAVRGLVNLNNNAKLKEITLAELQHVEGNLEVKENNELETVSLPKLKAVNGGVDFQQNNQMRKIVFDMLHSVEGKFYFRNNNVLNRAEAPDLRRIGAELDMSNNNQLDVLSMPLLATIGGGLRFYSVGQLDSLSFPRLTQIGGRLYFYDVGSCEYISLPELTFVKGSFEMRYASSIVSISMPKLMEIEGTVELSSGLQNLRSISMPRLSQVKGTFQISNCDALGSLSDFGSLSTIQGDLRIYNNKQLQCIKGLSNITGISSQLSIYDNTKLFMCSELYASLRTAANNNVNDQNSYVNRDDCDHVCDIADVRQDCVLGDFGNWSTCSDVCGPATQFRTQEVVKAATNGGRCEKKTESQNCEKSRFNTDCDDAVSKIIAGTWKEDDSSTQKVCDGGEIDDASQLAKYDGCEIISGNLKFFIAEDVDFDKVQTFSSLLAVSGDVVFFGTALTNLAATIFANLQVIGGKFLIGHNNQLVSLKAFRSLHTVGEDYKIDQNEKLFTCETSSVVTIGGAFQVLTNKKLSAVTMPKVASVGGELRFYNNRELKTAIYLELKTVGAVFYFEQNSQLVTAEMPSLATVAGEFLLNQNYQLKVASFSNLKTVGDSTFGAKNGGTMRLSNNYQMQTLDMSALETVTRGSLYFNGNNAIRDVVFPSLTWVASQFEFNSNSQMEFLSCPQLAKLGSTFQVNSNNRLKEISMPRLAEIRNQIEIQNNPQLTAIKDFGKLTTVKSSFRIQNNHKLQCIRGFGNVTRIDSELCIQQNSKLFMCDELADGLKKAADRVCSSFSYVPRDNCDHVCE